MNFLKELPVVNFPTNIDEIWNRVENVDPILYGRSRNFIDGAVTYLSPYLSRGVISTRQVMEWALNKGYDPKRIEKFIQELAWRDYWQQVWIEKGDEINGDLRFPQEPVENFQIPAAIVHAETRITAIDKAIEDFYETGYLHNHLRMYIASIACNVGKSHWKVPAQWMYYHLLDGDWASNALSWQWVAGANSSKKYYANQENINKYCYTNQRNTFLDIDYSEFEHLPTPKILSETIIPSLKTQLPTQEEIAIDPDKSTLIYNFYNLDPEWKKDIHANRVLLLESSHFEAYPVSEKTINFILGLSKNISGIQVFVGEFGEFIRKYNPQDIYFKEHPLNQPYKGTEEHRDWMFGVKGYYRSFFAFWKKCKKELKVK